ncbi:hypothetical protein [Nostoc sp. NMS4]|uniref:scabin-related ADP-ribosyltransferase n=1 Tax=Nostoc sp. NMS4 TaxID=2815390 RepID=UPI0025FB4FFF|nr:hypothetical protein [Nostoc sp. NMS4]MBN3923992.1 hypothetical protein [Nostoc sp. NMS4]
MTFQRIQKKTASTKSETPRRSQLTSRPFAPIIQHPIPTPHQQPEQTKELIQRKTNLLPISLMPPPKKVIQAKLKIGEPGDKYEQEADTVARQVVQGLNAPARPKTNLLKVSENQVIQAQWWKSVFSKNPQHLLAKYKVIDQGFRYRVDTRLPSEIAKEGFFAKVITMPVEKITMEDIKKYQISAMDNPGIVSTAVNLQGAITFAHQLGKINPGRKYIYEMDVSGLIEFPQNENIPIWQRIFYSDQQESMIAFGIEPERIKLVRELDTSGEESEINPFVG